MLTSRFNMVLLFLLQVSMRFVLFLWQSIAAVRHTNYKYMMLL